jgi:hypothetical protein
MAISRFCARYVTEARASDEIRITSDGGADLNPVAATDSAGRVWVAWQGFRKGNLEVLAAVEQGDRMSEEAVVSFSATSDWDPAIAAAPNGEVAISWDTYDKGAYDVYARRAHLDGGTALDDPIPVAASLNFGASGSIGNASASAVDCI